MRALTFEALVVRETFHYSACGLTITIIHRRMLFGKKTWQCLPSGGCCISASQMLYNVLCKPSAFKINIHLAPGSVLHGEAHES